MGCLKFLPTNRQLCICLLAFAFFCLSASPSLPFLAQGRQLSKLSAATLKTRNEEIKAVKIMRSMIGSKPPRCEGRCKSCGQCRAVQVPIVPTKKSLIKAAHFHANIAYSRGDDISNYMPMCWKCKCGDFFFNPW
ncbi:EPIDERMAL PATTERNING FACTOR-like protein 2 [Sesamum indicum]|uniref:Epidermal patterning factor-like protein n=1 Tax=Sesamum indicum TaxID=4182 RepID=A0A6I9SUH0_SESIN|nr:EPIDERMAL PATTERNING FACTOR-like protein 2 [Sesamum indicum]XP_020548557.1 EPIDERMAL PATTERNING FACTOR-like protein 2 [Sesamum indicum]